MNINKINNEKKIIFFLIFIISLLPLLWLKPGYFITGNDINYPLILENRFLIRFFSWNDYSLLGNDKSAEITTLFFHIPDLIGKFIFQLKNEYNQIFSFVFWNALMVISFNFLLKKLSGCFYFRIFSILTFSINYYFFFAWRALQYNLLSIILFILILAFIIEILNRGFFTKKDSLKIFTVYLFLSIYSIQSPIIYVFYVFVFLFLFLHFLNEKFIKKKIDFFYFKVFFIICTLSVFSSFYWILNLTNFIFTSVFAFGDPLTIFQIKSLLEWCSSNISIFTSFLNMSDVAFSGNYFPQVAEKIKKASILDFISITSYLIAIICGFVLCINSKDINFRIFGFFFVISVILSSGIRPPFGFIYQFLVSNFPGFFVIRAPWMKFGMILTISSSILIGYFFSYLIKNLKDYYMILNFSVSKKILKISLISLFIFFYLAYRIHYITGDHFTKKEDIKVGGYHYINSYTNYLKVPDYIFNMTEFINKDKEFSRIVFLPLSHTNNYNWGYGGPGDITSELIKNKSAIFITYGEGMTFESEIITKKINILKKNILEYSENNVASTYQIKKISEELNIKYFLNRKDFNISAIDEGISNVEKYDKFLKDNKDIIKEIKFGEWELYKINNFKNTFVHCKDKQNNLIQLKYTKINSDNVLLPKIDKNCDLLFLSNSKNRNWVIIEDGSYLNNLFNGTKAFLKLDQKNFFKDENNNDYLNVWKIQQNLNNDYKNLRIIFYQNYLRDIGFILVIISFFTLLITKDNLWKKIRKN